MNICRQCGADLDATAHLKSCGFYQEKPKMHYCPDCETRCYCEAGQTDSFNCLHCETPAKEN